MSAAVMTRPPSAVRRSLICSQRPSTVSTSRKPGREGLSTGVWARTASSASFSTALREAPGFRTRGSSEKTSRKV